MVRVDDFDPRVATTLPTTYALLKSANLMVHPAVARLTLHGSRGLAGRYGPESDIDLCLIVDVDSSLAFPQLEPVLHAVFDTTYRHWQAAVEPDLAIVFDARSCGLKCFDESLWNEQICLQGGTDCFGLYKEQKGFNGLVTEASIQVRLMYPCLRIWQRK